MYEDPETRSSLDDEKHKETCWPWGYYPWEDLEMLNANLVFTPSWETLQLCLT